MDTLGLKIDVVQRSKGQDARRLAAYQLCGRIAAGGRVFDFTRKRAEHQTTLMLAPEGAPAWTADPAALWTRAETAERRGDAQPARALMISLPRAVPADRREGLVRELVSPFVARGMCAQADVHAPAASDGEAQPHVHILLTMRPLDGDGFSARKAREWNTLFRNLLGVRREMAERMNAWAARHAIQINVHHQSRVARGHDLPAEPTIPRSAWAAWNRDRDSEAAALVRAVLDARRAVREAAAAGAAADHAAGRLRARYGSAREACWTAYRAEKQAARAAAQEQRRRAEKAARDELRARQWAERSHLRQTLRRGSFGRAVGELIQTRRHDREQHAARLAAYRVKWTTSPSEFPAFDAWVAGRAAAGDEAAWHVARAGERKARRGRSARDAAAAFVQAEERASTAALRASEPRGATDPRKLYDREADHLARRRDAALRAAQDAERQAREARGKVGVWGALFGGEALREAAAARQAAAAAVRRTAYATADHDAGLRAASEAAEAVARENRARSDAWERAPETAALRRRRDAARAAAAAVEAGDRATIAAAAEGDLAAAAGAARVWQQREQEQRAEQDRQAKRTVRGRAAAEMEAARQAAAARPPRTRPRRAAAPGFGPG